MAQKITPNLWFDGNAEEAIDYYISVFPDSKINDTAYYPKSKDEGLADFQTDLAGKVVSIDFELDGTRFTAINADSTFRPNPSISFFVNFDPASDEQAKERLDELWDKLKDGGEVLMELDTYPFSEHYGWVKDRYGFSWQLITLNPQSGSFPAIMPSLMFTKDDTGRAEEAIGFYTSVFEDSKVGMLAKYQEDTGPAKQGDIMYGDFTLDGQWLAAMDSGVEQDFKFNEAISLSISCKDQTEIDYFWDKLSVVPESEQCGWLKDKYGVSWQVVPENINELLKRPDGFKHMMEMQKLVIDEF